MAKYGTSHFVNRASAIRYFRGGEDYVAEAVDRKLANGEIHLGKPEVKPHQLLTLIDNETRYGIEELDNL